MTLSLIIRQGQICSMLNKQWEANIKVKKIFLCPYNISQWPPKQFGNQHSSKYFLLCYTEEKYVSVLIWGDLQALNVTESLNHFSFKCLHFCVNFSTNSKSGYLVLHGHVSRITGHWAEGTWMSLQSVSMRSLSGLHSSHPDPTPLKTTNHKHY